MTTLWLDKEYQYFLTEIKQQYHSSQLKAAFSVNTEMIQFYWSLGGRIIEKQKNPTWGSKFLEQLAEVELDMKAKALTCCEVVDDEKKRKPWRDDKDLMSFLDSL